MTMKKCPRCSNTKIWELATGQLACSKCHSRWFPPKTYWQMSRLSGQHKARLIEYFCLGVPAYRLRFLMSVSQKTVQRFYKLLRICLYQNSLQLLSPHSGTFEMDETMFGGYRPDTAAGELPERRSFSAFTSETGRLSRSLCLPEAELRSCH